jgi:hypothetical protein
MPSEAAMPQTPPKFAVGDLVVLSLTDDRVKEVVDVRWVKRKGTWAYRCQEVGDPESTQYIFPERVLMRYEPPAAVPG